MKFIRSMKDLARCSMCKWSRNANSRPFKAKTTIQAKLSVIDKILYQGGSSEDILNARSTLLKELNNINIVDSLEKAQKAKIRWAIKGDENSKYFHNILNKKRSQLAIRGLAEADWIVDPHLDDLERNVTLNEIKSAVWDYGTNKSPGLDGFTFEFFRRYWKFLEQYIMVVVTEFFSSGVFPSGCNSSFIALITNIQDAKVVNDFRPINFEKAFDSIRWDYLDDVLRMFGFGIKWRGLKQCDPLSPFLFILVMERLHLSFRKVMDAGLFSGISINNSLTISNLLYAGDAVFVGKWDMSNIRTIVNVLKCFHLASGLKLNIHKSKIIRVGIRAEEVDLAAREVDDMALKHRYPRLYALELSKYISVSEKLSSDSLVFSFRRIPKGGIEEEQQRSLQARIEGIILAPMLDRWIWSYESSGEFSVKSARSFIDDSLLPKEDVPTRWVNVIPI
ncbi:RNA-directed DNA polymerase, eukaryota [Tanacetum coccineum]